MKKSKEKVIHGFWVEYSNPGEFSVIRGKSNAPYSSDWQFFKRLSEAKKYIYECMRIDSCSLFSGKCQLEKLKAGDL